MAVYSISRRVEAPPQEVFDFLTDQGNLPSWSPQVVSSQVVGGGPVEEGSRLRQVRRRGRREMASTVQVVLHRPPARHVVAASVLGMGAVFSFHLRPVEGGTVVTMTGALEGSGWRRPLAGTLVRPMEKADTEAMDRLQAHFSRSS